MLRISIPTPCHADWNKMSPREQGAFCSVCAKTVVDFTRLSDEQVKNYFLENPGKKTCGRFRKEQLDDADFLPRLLSHNIPLWKKFIAAVFILCSSFMTSCDNVIGKIVPEETETQLIDFRTYEQPGTDTMIEMSEMKAEPLIDPSPVFTPYVIVGDVAVEPIGEMVTGTPAVIIPDKPDTVIFPVYLPSDCRIDLSLKKDLSDSIVVPAKKECDPGKDSNLYYPPE